MKPSNNGPSRNAGFVHSVLPAALVCLFSFASAYSVAALDDDTDYNCKLYITWVAGGGPPPLNCVGPCDDAPSGPCTTFTLGKFTYCLCGDGLFDEVPWCSGYYHADDGLVCVEPPDDCPNEGEKCDPNPPIPNSSYMACSCQ